MAPNLLTETRITTLSCSPTVIVRERVPPKGVSIYIEKVAGFFTNDSNFGTKSGENSAAVTLLGNKIILQVYSCCPEAVSLLFLLRFTKLNFCSVIAVIACEGRADCWLAVQLVFLNPIVQTKKQSEN